MRIIEYPKSIFTKELVEKGTKPLQVEAVVGYLLEENRIFASEDAMSSKELYDAYLALKESSPRCFPDLKENTFIVVLNRLSGDINNICCDGRKQGYYLYHGKNARRQEKVLYPLFVEWLDSIGYHARDTSQGKSRKWQNPDVTGWRTTIVFGSIQSEIATIEVKDSLMNWRAEIFEAVAHKKFSNRSYYAFRCSEYELQENRRALLEYAERFRIGLLAITKESDDTEALSIADIQEIVPAPYDWASPFDQSQYINSHKLTTL